MARRGASRPSGKVEHDLDQGLRELESLKVTPTEPTHLGNFESHIQTGAGEPVRPGDEPEPEGDELEAGAEGDEGGEDLDEGEGVEAGAEDLEDAEYAPDSDSPPESDEGLSPAQLWQRDRANMAARLENQERELQFLRASQQGQVAPAQPVNPLAEIPLPFSVTEADVQELMQGGPNAVTILNRALQLTAVATAQHTAGVLAQAYQQARQNETGAETTVSSFYRQNPDLADFPEVVQSQANQVWAEFPHAPDTTKLEETARRCRARLKGWGLSQPQAGKRKRGRPRKGAAAAADQGEERQPARRRPAFSEMGGRGGRGNGNARLSAKEKEMYELIP